MNCYSCGAKMIWNSDHEDEDGNEIITSFSCSKCNAMAFHHQPVTHDCEVA